MKADTRSRQLTEALKHSSAQRQQFLESAAPAIVDLADRIASALRKGGKIFLFGNGGSAGDAQHIAAEFTGRFVRERRAWPALALTTDSSALTAIGNDYGFAKVFVRQLDAFAQPGDVAIGISTSGNSENVIQALQRARQLGVLSVGFSGRGGGLLAREAELCLTVPFENTARIQECHIMIGHLLCELVEEHFFSAASADHSSLSCQAMTERKIMPLADLVRRRTVWREQQKTVVWTNGCFDIIHAGHIQSLEASRQLGDLLVVGLNSDASVRRLKGASRPIILQHERAILLAALGCVDAVTIYDEDTPEASLRTLQPDIHCKGADYAPPQGKPIPERAMVESYGGQVMFLPLLPGVATTDIVARIRSLNAS